MIIHAYQQYLDTLDNWFTIPEKDLVLAVVSSPTYKAENYIVLHEGNEAVGFDRNQFDRLIEMR